MKRTIFLLASIVILLGPVHSNASEAIQRTFIWNEANGRMATALTEDDFMAAASTYQKLADAGAANGTLYYNLGTALMLGGQHDEAIGQLLRAERHLGSTWEIERNLRVATNMREKGMHHDLPWYRVPLFWHFGLPCNTRVNIAVWAFVLLWAGLALRWFKIIPRIAGPVIAVSVVVFVLFAFSAFTSIHQEHSEPPRPAFSSEPPQTGVMTPPGGTQ